MKATRDEIHAAMRVADVFKEAPAVLRRQMEALDYLESAEPRLAALRAEIADHETRRDAVAGELAQRKAEADHDLRNFLQGLEGDKLRAKAEADEEIRKHRERAAVAKAKADDAERRLADTVKAADEAEDRLAKVRKRLEAVGRDVMLHVGGQG